MAIAMCAHCGRTLTITGDGSHPFRSHPIDGGKYFCNTVCLAAYLVDTATPINGTVTQKR